MRRKDLLYRVCVKTVKRRVLALLQAPLIFGLMFGVLALGIGDNAHSQAFPAEPEVVGVGIKIDQITSINQKDKNFSVVATLRMDWTNAELAFDPEPGEPEYRTYRGAQFLGMITERGITWPAISLYNQQGRLAVHNELVYLSSAGRAQYLRRFTATFQAPDFDFTRFPFDVQRFNIKVDSIFGERRFLFRELEELTGLGDELGAEEWIVTGVSSEISTQSETTGIPSARLTLEFTAKRHLIYYVLRLLVPSLLIVLVSWFSFFLRDYSKRVDLASGNLLLFIAFNFTIGNELPRLGYITIIDAYLAGLFVITGTVVLANVLLKRMQYTGRDALLQKLDRFALMAYPLGYLLLIGGIAAILA